ncbi:MAG TPA: Gfo/Idh/MocA family oxidoreductase [Candidatus Acidoferrum sp.]|nr:Gfo/Idh/MocA family oxidoreductase [Candidatus Acidoferrum sp.]
MRKIKTGVIGVGALGRHHVRWLTQIADSELVGVYDIDHEKASKYAAEYKVTAFDSLDAMVGKVEAVAIVVPTTAHFEIASFCIENGIHCLIEKPITSDLSQALKLSQLARTRGIKITVGQIERFNPAVRALKDYAIKPSFIEAHRLAAFDPRGTDVAVVLDLMIHDIDLCLSFIKSPVVEIHASAVAVISEQADIANARLMFANGAAANLTASRISLRAMRKLRIFQKSGYYSLDLAEKQADIYRLAGKEDTGFGLRVPLGKSGQDLLYSKKADDGQDMLGTELTAFVEAVLHDKPVAVTVDEGTEALRVALEIERIGLSSIARMLQEPA